MLDPSHSQISVRQLTDERRAYCRELLCAPLTSNFQVEQTKARSRRWWRCTLEGTTVGQQRRNLRTWASPASDALLVDDGCTTGGSISPAPGAGHVATRASSRQSPWRWRLVPRASGSPPQEHCRHRPLGNQVTCMSLAQLRCLRLPPRHLVQVVARQPRTQQARASSRAR